MNKKIIHAPEGKAPKALGPYSQGVRVGDFVFLSGQLGLDPSGTLKEGGIVPQTEQVLANITALLAVEGMTLAHVVKATVFMADLAEFAAMNEVYARHFQSDPPARSTFQVARLPRDAKIEIEVVAHA